MKKFLACFIAATFIFVANVNAQTDSIRLTWKAGFNLAPQVVYQFGNDKPTGDIGLFATTTLATKNAGLCAFYGMKNNSMGLFIYRGITTNWSVYSVGFKSIHDRGKYIGVGTMYQFGTALVFCELGAPLDVENTNPMICAGLFIGFGKDIKKWK